MRGDGVGGVGGVADVEGCAGLHGVDGADLPATEDGVGEGVAAAEELTVVPEGQIVDEAGDVGDGQVVVGLTVVGGDVVGVLRRGRVAFERGAGVVERVRPGEGVQEAEPGDEALLVTNLQGVVVGVELVEGCGDIAGPVAEGASKAVGGVLLVAVEEALKLGAMVADVGDVEESVLGELLLHAEEVALDVAVAGVFGNPGDVVCGGIEGGGDAVGESLVGGDVAGCSSSADRAVVGGGWRLLRDGDELSLRGVDGEDIAGAGAGVVDVAGAVSAADGGAWSGGVGKAKAGSEVVEVRVDECVAVDATAGEWSDAVARHSAGAEGEDGLRDGIEVGDVVMLLGVGRAVLPTEAEVEGELVAGLPVVLGVDALQGLAKVGDEEIGEGVVVGGAEEEVGPVVVSDGAADVGAVGIGCGFYAVDGGAGAEAEALRVAEGAVEGIVVVDGHPDVLVLIAEFEGVFAFDPGEVDLGIEQGGVLPLGVGALTAEGGEAAADAGGGKSAGDGGVGGKARDGDGVVADGERELAGFGTREAQACIEDLVGAHEVGVAEGDLLIEDADGAVGLAVEGKGEDGVVDAGLLAIADAEEPGVVGVLLVVETKITLVGVVGEGDLRGVVVLVEAGGGQTGALGGNLLEEADDLLRDGIDGGGRDRGASGVDLAGDGVLNRYDELAVEFVGGGDGVDAERLEDLAEAFVVDEVEELVLDDGTAEVDAELVAVEGGLAEGDNVSAATDEGGLEVAGCVEVGVAEELVDGGVEAVGSAVGGDVDGGAGGAAVLCALVVGDDLELGDGVGRDGDDLVVEALVALAVGVVVHTVEEEVVEHAALAVDVVGASADERADGAGGRSGGGLADAGDEAEEVGVVAADERIGGALILGDDLAALAGFGFNLEGDVADFNGGRGGA